MTARSRKQRRAGALPASAAVARESPLLDVPDLARRVRAHIGFTDRDSRLLARLHRRAASRYPGIIDDFYGRLLADPQTARILSGPEQVERLRRTLTGWLERTLRGPHDAEFVRLQANIGRRHVEVGLEQSYMVTGMHVLRDHLARVARAPGPRGGGNAAGEATVRAVDRVIDLSLTLMLATYREDSLRQALRAEQHATMKRLAAIGEMAASIAHEIRNPLAGISGAIQVLREEPAGGETRGGVLEEVLREIRRLDARINDLLIYARPATPRREPVRPADLLHATVRVLRDDPVLARVRLRFGPMPSLPPFALDAGQIQQVLVNLVLNAAQATAGEGEIRLEARGVSGGGIEISVEDDGPGVPDHLAEEIFRPFFTTRSGGTGLGLAISRKIAEAHGGALDVLPASGGGARFTLRLPALPEGPPFDARMRGNTQVSS
jgi:signal transduction histidine kinase